jgi:phage-related protein
MINIMKEFIAYEGSKYRIEWYFNEKGVSQALDFFLDLSAKEQQKVFYLIKRIGDFGFISDKTKFRNEGDQIYAFKPKPDRYLSFFYKGERIILTNAFTKKTDKLPKNEKDRALVNRDDYIYRNLEGNYYE